MNYYKRRDANFKRCAFTGYRPSKMPFGYNEADPRCINFKGRLRDAIERLVNEGFVHFISGGALGMDMFAAEAVLALKAGYPWIMLEMVSPFDAQAARWDLEHRARHDHLFAEADLVTRIEREYTKACMFRRNRYLVDNADLLLAAFDGQPGGTAMTVNYAREAGIRVEYIAPVQKLNDEENTNEDNTK